MGIKTVLFVDDQEEILFLIKRMLKDEEYNKLFASSAREALKIMENNSVDVIVTDMIMPDMSGLELLEILKIKYPEVVRIVLSGYSQVSSILLAINSGDIYRFITKPWKIDDQSKKIIKEALQYSDYLKNLAQCNVNPNAISINLDKFEDLLKDCYKDYVLIKNGIVILNSLNVENIENINTNENFNKINLYSNLELYIPNPK